MAKESNNNVCKDDELFPSILQPILDQKADNNNTIDLNAYALGLLDCYQDLTSNMYTEEEVRQLVFRAYNLRTEDGDVRSTKELTDWFNKNKK